MIALLLTLALVGLCLYLVLTYVPMPDPHGLDCDFHHRAHSVFDGRLRHSGLTRADIPLKENLWISGWRWRLPSSSRH